LNYHAVPYRGIVQRALYARCFVSANRYAVSRIQCALRKLPRYTLIPKQGGVELSANGIDGINTSDIPETPGKMFRRPL